jgi:thiol-disulfide isomerase/thioredoxin
MAPPKNMIPLETQEQFEELLRPRTNNRNTIQMQEEKKYAPCVGIAFGASWCGPCRRIDKDLLASKTPFVKWYYCDVDVNNYTLGYCGLKSIPSFILIQDGHVNTNMLSNVANLDSVIDWVNDRCFSKQRS